MKIIVETGHPAHVHSFKYIIRQLTKNGHTIKICTTDKDLTLPLLKAEGFEFDVLGINRSGSLLRKAALLVKAEYRMMRIARRFRPALFVSRGSPISAHISRIFRKPHIIFNDTECAVLTDIITIPFSDAICTPSCFKKDYGEKHVRFEGYKELAYLHPNYFQPDPSVLRELGLNASDKFAIIRFVAWQATHDIGQHGFEITHKRKLISELEKHARVFISSENPLPDEFQSYKIPVRPEKMHDLLNYASLYIGEGATMATEAAVLGTPSIYISTLNISLGYISELENDYGLIYSSSKPEDAIEKAKEFIKQPNLKAEWSEKRRQMLANKTDVTKFMVDFIENYPESFHAQKQTRITRGDCFFE
jgi:predicted glycosyltransferase